MSNEPITPAQLRRLSRETLDWHEIFGDDFVSLEQLTKRQASLGISRATQIRAALARGQRLAAELAAADFESKGNVEPEVDPIEQEMKQWIANRYNAISRGK